MARKLLEYRAKRDFKKTAEPRGGTKIRKAEYPRFVIQKHDATRLHYDLRLEMDGVFKSWAVTRGPSLDPNEKRLAVEVEDHPLEYGDFEGTIPDNEYGGGTVMLWDRGFWVPEGTDDPAKALREGELKFLLAGDKLQGGWVLVRMKFDRDGGKRTNWLLIKHRDDGAKDGDGEGVLKKDRSVASGRTMNQIAKGEGKGPQSFMLSRRRAAVPDAVWHSREAGKPAASPATRKSPAGSRAAKVNLTNPDKILWPAVKRLSPAYTKRDLAEYLETVGPWMIEHLRGRPCSVIRAPDGIEGQTFFQRHAMKGTSELIGVVKVAGDREPYIQLDHAEALVAMAQAAALEFHPWGCQPDDPEAPGRLVFDLDPAPDVPFTDVIAAAKELKTRLEDLGLIAFCKTTGGKGLHVVTPLAAGKDNLGWDEAKTFARTICAAMTEDDPDRYLIKMTKKLRKGRIFLDYLRNDRMATAVAPLSPRARPGAPVSMPLNWSQVREGLDPKRYTMRTAWGLLSKSKAWEDYCDSERPLRQAIEHLVEG